MASTSFAPAEMFDWKINNLFINEGDKNAKCVICNTVILNKKHFNIVRHYGRFHAKEYDTYTLEQKFQIIQGRVIGSDVSERKLSDHEKSTAASYAVAWKIAKSKKYFRDGMFIKDCAIAMAKAFENDVAVEQFKSVRLSRQTISRRIRNVDQYLENKLRALIQKCVYFSLCLNKSTDLNNIAQLSIFIRLVQPDFSINEELLALVPLNNTTAGVGIFEALKMGVEKYTNFNRCSCILTDGAPNMVETNKGLSGILKQNGVNCPVLHCIMHREELCTKFVKLSHIMKIVSEIISLILSGNRSLNHRKLKLFLKSRNAPFNSLLMYTETRWLSAGNCLQRFFALRKLLADFLKMYLPNEKVAIREELCTTEFLCGLAFLTDITTHFNSLNLNLQGKGRNIAHLFDYINGFKNQLNLYAQQIEQEDLSHFPCCKEIAQEIPEVKFSSFQEYVVQLLAEFNVRFNEFDTLQKDIMLFVNPLQMDIKNANMDLQVELCNLHADPYFAFNIERAENLFKVLPAEKYQKLRNFGLKIYSMFASTYMCETSSSAMNVIKTNKLSALKDINLLNALRVAMTELELDIPRLVKNK